MSEDENKVAGREALALCMGITRGECGPAQELWDKEFNRKEQEIFLVAARLPLGLAGLGWKELSVEKRVKLKAAMLRFAGRFSVLLSRLVVMEGTAKHVNG